MKSSLYRESEKKRIQMCDVRKVHIHAFTTYEEEKNGIRKIIITIFMSRPLAVIVYMQVYLVFHLIYNTNHKSVRNKSYTYTEKLMIVAIIYFLSCMCMKVVLYGEKTFLHSFKLYSYFFL